MSEKIPTKPSSSSESLTLHQRFERLIEALELTPNNFATKIGMASTQVYSIINGRNAPSHRMYEAIILTYPQVNIYYVIVGRGHPLKPGKDEVVGLKNVSRLKSVEKKVQEMDADLTRIVEERVIQVLKSGLHQQEPLSKVKKRKVNSH